MGSAALYEEWAQNYEKLRETFLSFAMENEKNEKNIRRVYYGVVSDALETNFCFKGLKGDVSLPLPTYNTSYSELLKICIHFEESIYSFYCEAAKTAKTLFAELPRSLERGAGLRKARLSKLRSLLVID